MILQIKITLRQIEPPVWREIMVDDSLTFNDLHAIIQLAMGWTNSHLHQFEYKKDHVIGDPRLLEEADLEFKLEDSRFLKLSSYFNVPGKTMKYIYDFGDWWEHDLVLEQIYTSDKHFLKPICIHGARNCPPEDCGGPHGYDDLLKIMKDSKHPDHQDMKTWVGRKFDPEKFEIKEINKRILKFKKMNN